MSEIKKKQPWPTRSAMQQIYDLNLWGNNGSLFYSGDGSHRDEFVKPYLDAVLTFLRSFENKLSVVDLGCGDFNIGNNLVDSTREYNAIDIVPELIEYNNKRFNCEVLKFSCLDVSKEEIPVGDCVIIRQVLQHLSNTEISKIVAKIEKYKYVILTEHIPNSSFIPNCDIVSGQGIRLKKKSGVDIEKEPFHFQFKTKETLCEVRLTNDKGAIRTVLYRN